MSANQTNKTQGRLLMLAALFLGLYALSLTLSPAIRAQSWETEYRWSHWLGMIIWLVGFGLIHRETQRRLPQRDPYLVPLIAMLSGWGLLTIWRLTTYYGMRQSLWLALALAVFFLGLRLPADLFFLRRFKYLWLTGGLTLTGLTLLLGTNPMGFGPRLWLGCCGFYMQPSEPLKLLLIVFLAAYFADWQIVLQNSRFNVQGFDVQSQEPRSKINDFLRTGQPSYRIPSFQILVPTLIMTGVALLLLVVQRDLGTASIFIFIYAVMVYLATGWRWIPAASAVFLAAAGALGYLLFDVVRLRIEAWINPWLDPIGRSYQIVQSLMSIANGGVFGRGPGMGSPTLVPVSHSDFIFSAIAEETGLVGMIGLLVLLGLLAHRGLLVALHTPDTFRRLLAAGLTAFLVGQSILIIGGNLRLLPLTGVTLPFVSYGGSSLMVSYMVVLLLLQISTGMADQSRLANDQKAIVKAPLLPITAFLLIGLSAAALTGGWWTFLRGPDLLNRNDNPRRALDDRYVYRGALLARGEARLAETTGNPGELSRTYNYPALGPVTGYNHPVYGQSGLEASLDPILRGLEGNDPVIIEWHHLLYGQPPPGLDVRLTLDMELQRLADDFLSGHQGALILLNAETGEILVMSSHPTFDPNLLDDTWDELFQNLQAPLINRVTQGIYPTGDLADQPFMQAASNPEVGPVALRLPQANNNFPEDASPLDVAFSAASLSNAGVRPAARLALSYQHPEDGWQIFPLLGTTVKLLTPKEVNSQIKNLASQDIPIWRYSTIVPGEELTWFLAGTLSGAKPPVTLVLILENENLPLVEEIGGVIMMEVISR